MRILLVAAFVIGGLCGLLRPWAAPAPASACRLIEFPGRSSAIERVRWAAAVLQEESERPPLILVGEVTSEMRVDLMRGPNPYERVYAPSPNQTEDDHNNHYYRSVVKPAAVLMGDWPAESLEMFLQPAPDCSGGPRLKEGETVLLLVAPTLIAFNGANREEALWELQPLALGGKVVFEDGEAYLNDLLHPSQYEPLGDARALVREVSAAVNAPPRQQQLALAAIEGGDGSHRDELVLAAAIAAAILLLVSLAAMTHLQRR
jgi:hypothetical protein